VHVERTRRLAAGESLADITDDLRRRFRVPSTLLPMSDDRVTTWLDTEAGPLEFQEYFVRRRCEPLVRGVDYRGAAEAAPSPGALSLLGSGTLECVVLCPSNPYLSVGPILAIPGLRRALEQCRAPVVVVSPVIGGRAVKGPTVKLMRELGVEPSPRTIARHYDGILDGLVLDTEDAALATTVGVPALVVPTLMQTLEDRERLARATLAFARTLAPGLRARRARA
jgi:LPPG:FO 2-phospho-L-lactate transferase